MEVVSTREHYDSLVKKCDEPSAIDLLLDCRFPVGKRLIGAAWGVLDGGTFSYLRSEPEYRKQLSERVITTICRDAVERIHPKLFSEYRLSYNLQVPILWPIVIKQGENSVLSCMLVESKDPQCVADRVTLYPEALRILGTYVAHFGQESCRGDLSGLQRIYLAEAKNWFLEAKSALVRDWTAHLAAGNPQMDPIDVRLTQLVEDVSFAAAEQRSAGNENEAIVLEDFLSKIGRTPTSTLPVKKKITVTRLLEENRAIEDPLPNLIGNHLGTKLPRY